YAAVLRPLAESGHTVVIPKQPFGIAFLSTGAFNAARTEHRPVARWVLGGHSLGGVVAAIDAQSLANDPGRPVPGCCSLPHIQPRTCAPCRCPCFRSQHPTTP
ncbi:hypothetical protein GY25_22625, partial [Pedobacter himalayensis]